MSTEHFEDDRISGWRVLVVAIVVVVTMAAAVAWSVRLDGHGAVQLGPSAAASARAAIEDSLLDAQSAPALLRAQQDQLATYRWVDRAHGIVAIPIDQAITVYAQRQP